MIFNVSQLLRQEVGASRRYSLDWFPDTDPQFKNADSSQLLRIVWNDLTTKGWSLINCDIVIMAQRPKLLPYIPQMRDKIAEILAVPVVHVGLKATTTERLGFVGREEGIAASAVCLLSSSRQGDLD